MELSLIVNIAEIIGTVAVVVSLVYVGIQVRQNTRSTKLATGQNLSHDLRETLAPIYSDSEFARIHLAGMKDVGSLTGVERYRVYTYIQSTFRAFENVYYHYRNGAVDAYVWDAFVAYMKFSKGVGSVEAFWQDRQHIFSKDFRDFFNELSAADPSIASAPYLDSGK